MTREEDIQQAPARLDRSRWEGCALCKGADHISGSTFLHYGPGQAAQKMRRAMHGTMPVSTGEALKALNEEAADVLVCIEMLAESGLLDAGMMRRTAKIKMNRWCKRTFLPE